MLEKIEILITIFVLLICFYLVITWGAGKKDKGEIKRYILGVRILIIILGITAFILWIFL